MEFISDFARNLVEDTHSQVLLMAKYNNASNAVIPF